MVVIHVHQELSALFAPYAGMEFVSFDTSEHPQNIHRSILFIAYKDNYFRSMIYYHVPKLGITTHYC